MIVKSMTRKTPSWGQLLSYMMKGAEKYNERQERSFVLQHNVYGNSIREWNKSFEQAESRRVNQRSNNVKVFHEILSWSDKDTQHMTVEKMKDMATQYMKIRNENAAYISVLHRNRDCWHLHFCISAVETRTGKSIRISKEEFKRVKERIQEYQKQRYPELINSLVNHEKKAKQQIIKESEFQLKKRSGQLSEKDRAKIQLVDIYRYSNSKNDFYSRVKWAGLKVYERGGKITGIVGNRKMRFSTLGLNEQKLNELDNYQDRMKNLSGLRETKDDDRGYDFTAYNELEDSMKPEQQEDDVKSEQEDDNEKDNKDLDSSNEDDLYEIDDNDTDDEL